YKPADKFCPHCGKRVSKEPIICPDCGKSNESTAVFCANCGKKLFDN
ncbi:MAG: zinc-ribbon domain-containing protein, partial [Malacoplasma sp.]|nr:zinc-ribbon domain-containing protein [Malacoplasma sp.]